MSRTNCRGPIVEDASFRHSLPSKARRNFQRRDSWGFAREGPLRESGSLALHASGPGTFSVGRHWKSQFPPFADPCNHSAWLSSWRRSGVVLDTRARFQLLQRVDRRPDSLLFRHEQSCPIPESFREWRRSIVGRVVRFEFLVFPSRASRPKKMTSSLTDTTRERQTSRGPRSQPNCCAPSYNDAAMVTLDQSAGPGRGAPTIQDYMSSPSS